MNGEVPEKQSCVMFKIIYPKDSINLEQLIYIGAVHNYSQKTKEELNTKNKCKSSYIEEKHRFD